MKDSSQIVAKIQKAVDAMLRTFYQIISEEFKSDETFIDANEAFEIIKFKIALVSSFYATLMKDSFQDLYKHKLLNAEDIINQLNNNNYRILKEIKKEIFIDDNLSASSRI